MRAVRLLFCFGFCIAATFGQNGSQFHDWTTPAGDKTISPQSSCSALRALTGYEFAVVGARVVHAADQTPEYCRVSGQILPEVKFQVDLPAAWNSRIYMFGNGGYAGENLDAPERLKTRAIALRHGFAVTSTNTGHDAGAEALASFASDPQKLIDYAFRSLHVTALTAKKIAVAYYGVAAAHSYFDGCSTGGREGLILAQRFPDDFDGIVVGAPVLNFTGTMVRYVSIVRALADAPIHESKLPLLASRIYEKCDAADGLKDGVIDDPRRCDFNPARDLPKCQGETEGAACFTAKQIESLETIYSDVRANGKTVFPGWPVGAEIAGPNGRSGWNPWFVNGNGPAISEAFSQTFFHYMTPVEANRFDVEKDLPKLEAIHEMLDATDPDLSRFRERGGRIVMYHGWADPALNPLMGIGYFEQVRAQMGASTADFFRLYMVPGMFHCGGGAGMNEFDAMTPLVRWVEQGKAQEYILAARVEAAQIRRTRPLCPYPQVARYKGTGSVDDAANFSCAAPN